MRLQYRYQHTVTEVVWISWTGPIVHLRVGALPLRRGSHR